ncbi:MAG: PD40 domain-containing protein [Ignavibacteriae bacterium]|nr:PD40 domain-containing protein [Ignavibacteriota bacterium]
MTVINFNRLLLILSFIVLVGCSSGRTQPKQLFCPPPPQQNCQHRDWNGTPYDTNSENVKKLDWYWSFEQVRQINTPNDEWCLSFYSNNKAALTYSDGNQQKAMLVRMVNPDKGTMESGIGVALDGSYGAFSFDGDDAAFSAEQTEDIIGNSNIYFGKLKGNLITGMKPAGEMINKNNYSWESQPAISPDGNVLFYSSDINISTSGHDLFFAVKLADGSWSEPINCGDMINSQCDELTPFVSKNGKELYFSSSGPETVGGYDIFVSQISPDLWNYAKRGDLQSLREKNLFSMAENLKPPLNTSADELFPSSPVDTDSLLYYSSNQKSGEGSLVMMQGGFDIYVRIKNIVPKKIVQKIKKIEKEPEVPKVTPTYILEGTVFNATTKEPVPNAEITVKQMPEKTTYTETKSNKQGDYKVKLEKNKEYEIVAQARDLFFDAFSMRVEPTDTLTYIEKDIYIPENLTLRVNFPTDEYSNPYRYTIDSNGVETSMTWESSIDILAENLMKSKEYLEKIIFYGHTDDVGTEEYNKQLGQRRVDFIIAQLVKRGVPAKILEGKSAGEIEPLPQRLDEDIKMWRKRCRRVELVKVNKS